MTSETSRPIDAELLRELLDYDPLTGVFRWKARPSGPTQWNNRWAGKEAGTIDNVHGYVLVSLFNKTYRANRLAWLHVHGCWPTGVVDHINGVRTENRIDNLRDVSKVVNGQNQRKATKKNRSTGLLGATFDKRKKKFRADITVKGKCKHLGYFTKAEDAHQAYLAAKRACHEGCSI
ncbi:HNH endonuclease [Neopusillimonas maritima]|uniref:HNH nuclease domain-containing protein n=1 Tax=Neopusillimonas maritima TaxID=2026239 RepID=A0A3A1YWP1_9BURK|nr:HNH endonuclease [Neopusillimonas maritima]RIY41965.1 hypothetical protein CJP73_00520 [Neopusillimonas maritima]